MKTTHELTIKEIKSLSTSFIQAFREGVDAWIKAGEILVKMVDADPHAYDYIIQQAPELSAGILGKFEQMGRKTLHPQLLLTASPGFSKLSRMPYSVQQRYIEEPIPLIVHTQEGTDVLLVKAKDMTREQSNQIFAQGRIRTEGEQKAWLMQHEAQKAKPAGSNVSAWRVKNGRVEFLAGATLSAGELATIITQLTK